MTLAKSTQYLLFLLKLKLKPGNKNAISVNSSNNTLHNIFHINVPHKEVIIEACPNTNKRGKDR